MALEKLKEDDLRGILAELLCDHVNFSPVQGSHIATVIHKKLPGTDTTATATVRWDRDTLVVDSC